MAGGEKEYEIIINESNKKFSEDFLYKLYKKRMEIITNIVKRTIVENI